MTPPNLNRGQDTRANRTRHTASSSTQPHAPRPRPPLLRCARAESMLDVALKTARSSIILAAAAHDGGGEGAIDTEGANDPESISP